MTHIYVDGIFKLAPLILKHMYVVLAEKNGYVFPWLYCLLVNKQQCTYERLFDFIHTTWPALDVSKELCINFVLIVTMWLLLLQQPVWVLMDFEQSAFQPLQDVFPNVQLFGCLFCLVWNMKKQLCEAGLTAWYKSNSDFVLQAKMIMALAFIPLGALDDALDALDNIDPALGPMASWFELNYIGGWNSMQWVKGLVPKSVTEVFFYHFLRDYNAGPLRQKGTRWDPVFPQRMWLCYELTLNGQQQTNNHAKAAHKRLQTELQMDHPTIWKLIDGLKRIQKGRDILYERMVSGQVAPAKRYKYRQADERLLYLVHDCEIRLVLEYLWGIAHDFKMNV